MKKIGFIFVLLFLFASRTLAQNDFGNDIDRNWRRVFPSVPRVDSIWTNDGTLPIEFDPRTAGLVNYVDSMTKVYQSGVVHFLKKSGARLQRIENYRQPIRTLRGDTVMQDIGTVIFLILPDEKAYVPIFVTQKRYTVYFSRESKPLGSAYDAFQDAKIVGMDGDIDQRTLGQILYKYLPHYTYREVGNTETR